MSLTSTGPQEAEFYLGAADYELDRAVQMYYGPFSLPPSCLYGTRPFQCQVSLTGTSLICPFSCCVRAEQQPATQQSAALQHRAVAPPAQHNAPATPQPATRRRRQRQGFLHKLLRIPVAVINVGAQVIFSIYNLGVTLTTGIGSRVLPQSIQRNLQGVYL